jgi:hypothetical protein
MTPSTNSRVSATANWKEGRTPLTMDGMEQEKMDYSSQEFVDAAPLNLSKKIMAIPREPSVSRLSTPLHVKLEA